MQLKIAQQSTEASQLNSALNNPLIGNSQRMRIVRAMIAKLANSNSTVLITGESGTGKELAARAIHELSPRRVGCCFRSTSGCRRRDRAGAPGRPTRRSARSLPAKARPASSRRALRDPPASSCACFAARQTDHRWAPARSVRHG